MQWERTREPEKHCSTPGTKLSFSSDPDYPADEQQIQNQLPGQWEILPGGLYFYIVYIYVYIYLLYVCGVG